MKNLFKILMSKKFNRNEKVKLGEINIPVPSPEEVSELEEEIIDKKLERIVIFPGSKIEYEEMVGYPVEIVEYEQDGALHLSSVDRLRWKFCYDIDSKKGIIEEKVEAIINANYYMNDGFFYVAGLPVCKELEYPEYVDRKILGNDNYKRL